MDVPASGRTTTLPDGSSAEAHGIPSTGDEDRYDGGDDDGSDDEGHDDSYEHEYEGAEDDD